MIEAKYYTKLENNKVQCLLCPHQCIINNGKIGICGVRKNIDGILYALCYGIISSIGVDPIEKKPLYHFYPGEDILSVGSYGCNFKCKFCQNYSISQNVDKGNYISPEELLSLVKKHNSIGAAYTYNEPLINYEYVLDCSKILKKHNLCNVLVTNGYINPDPLNEFLPYIYAANIDLKSIRDEFYKKLCFGTVEPVKNTIKIMFEAGVMVEVTNLVITDENDSDKDIDDLIDFVSGLSHDIPLHFSRYFPRYKFNNSETSEQKLIKIYEKAKKKLNYVYLGNMYRKESSNTYCPDCGALLIERLGYNIRKKLDSDKCPECGNKIYIKL